MSSYVGRHARLYDLFYGEKPYAEEARFVHERLQSFGVGAKARLLELACGTGSHAFVFEKLGYCVVAIDDSPDMLEVAREKAQRSGSDVEFQCQDMRRLSFPEHGNFDVVVCLFDSIGYVQTNEGVLDVMRAVQRCLRDGGLFMFEFWHAAAMLRAYDPVRVRRWSVPEGEIVRISETWIDPGKQLSHVLYDIYELRKDGTYLNLKETQVNRYFLVQEMRQFLEASNFALLKFFAAFQEDETITEDVWHVIAFARKKTNI
jgi:SAM-dependent methyltransferase